MPKKSIKKKAAFQAFCRAQVKAGLINHPDGGWRRAETGKSMDRDMMAGYKL